jgi:hypothetical protein
MVVPLIKLVVVASFLSTYPPLMVMVPPFMINSALLPTLSVLNMESEEEIRSRFWFELRKKSNLIH